MSDGKATASCPSSVTVNSDTTAPVPSFTPVNQTVEYPGAAVFTAPAFIDGCDPAPVVAMSEFSLVISGKEISKTQRQWTATDKAGNPGTAQQTITLVDTTAPIISSVPANISVTATSAAGATVNYPAAGASDNYGLQSVTYSKASGSTFPVGTTAVTITAIDKKGNESTASFNVTVSPASATPKAQFTTLAGMVNNLPLNKVTKALLMANLDIAKALFELNKRNWPSKR